MALPAASYRLYVTDQKAELYVNSTVNPHPFLSYQFVSLANRIKAPHSLPSPPKDRINSAPMLDNQANQRERGEFRQKGDKTEYRGTRRQLADVT